MTEHISAKIIKKSINSKTGDIITTFVLEYPRIIHAELLTHRVFSRNCASSRAIPVKTELARLKNKYFAPNIWDKNCKGMAPKDTVTNAEGLVAKVMWEQAFENAWNLADGLANLGVHKQLCNRLTEPFQIMQTVLTATNLNNFFILRNDSAAQGQIRSLAKAMLEAEKETEAENLPVGAWHIPFVDKSYDNFCTKEKILMSVARCARVSYKLHDGTEDWQKDLALAKRLIDSRHMSPTEHIAIAFPDQVTIGNFTGWMQYRKFIQDESGADDQDIPVINTSQALNRINKINPTLRITIK